MSLNTPAQPGLQSLAKSFEPTAIEAHWGPEWEQRGYFRAGYRGTGQPNQEAASTGKNFAIQLPPPNVTGTLHMGHAFNQTVMDALTRYHRMRGFNTAWIPGTDHAGIATQIVVERKLQEKGLTRHDLGSNPDEARLNFVAQVWQWKQESGNTITNQMRRIGASVDWQREYFTMDETRSRAVTEAFVRLYEQGLIYRGKRLVNWDPKLKTAVSDLEVESIKSNGKMHYILYPFIDGPQLIDGQECRGMTIATTRPETMMADGALAVHPEDSRYQHLIGKLVELPLINRNIPIIADKFVDPAFGSGAVKITGAHDFNDYACSLRHDLPLITIFTLDAHINEAGPVQYHGMDRFTARKTIVQDLEAGGYLLAVKPHEMMLPTCTRTGEVVEPMLTDQWFVAMSSPDVSGKSITQKAIDTVHSGQTQFVPENWINTFNQWMNNIQDWTISRQLWWGHQIPAWYDDEGHVYVASDESQAQQQAGNKKLHRDPDVLDTWFSSALVPFSTMGWPEHVNHIEGTSTDCNDAALYLPSTVLVTGYDIIFFWVARMVMLTQHFTNRIPFQHVYMHGLVRDAQGKKMSKSEGNVLDPVDLIDGINLADLLEKRTQGLRRPETAPEVRKNTQKEFPSGIPAYGADALRFTFAALASLGRNINFDSKRCEGYRNFCNKLWNASRFVLMHCEGHDFLHSTNAAPCTAAHSIADRWIVSRLQKTKANIAQSFTDYRLDIVANELYDFIWNEFCDWYLEIAKTQLQNNDVLQQQAARTTLISVLEEVLRLAHPLIPFVTEALWQVVAPVAGKIGCSITIADYPLEHKEYIDCTAEKEIDHLKKMIEACRNLRGEMTISPAQRLPLYITTEDESQRALLEASKPILLSLAKLNEIRIFSDAAAWAQAAQTAPIAVVGNVRLCLYVEIDIAAEQARLQKEINKIKVEIKKAQTKLSNEAFIAKAPPEVIEQERQRLENFTDALSRLREQFARVQ